MTALIRGAKLYDPRDGATRFSEDPALMMRHVLVHPQFGKRTSLSAAEDARVIAAANICESAASYTGSDLVALYRAALVVQFGGTVIPYIKPFTVIKNISGTLQANGSGGETLETTKTPNLSPVVRVFNAAHTSVGGVSVDLTLYGY